MRQMLAVLALAIACGLMYWVWHGLRRYREKKEAEAARMADFLARAGALAAAAPVAKRVAAAPHPAASDAQAAAQQSLLFEAATKAGEAGEPALAIELYARLIARYPASALAGEARSRIEAQKKLIKA